MRIVGARWTPNVNVLQIACVCGYLHSHRADRWMVRCPKCRRSENLALIRERYARKVP